MKDFTGLEKKYRTSLFRKVNWTQQGTITPTGMPLKQRKKVAKAKKANNTTITVSGSEFKPLTYDIGMEPDPIPPNFYTFHDKTLDDLSETGPVTFLPDNWDCTVKYENNGVGRIYIDGVGVSQEMMGMTHIHSVFESIHFKNVLVDFEIEGSIVTVDLDIDSSPVIPMTVREYYGYAGEYLGNDKYQAGVMQSNSYLFYCADTTITLIVEYSFVFMYPNNDFEPSGVIDASKIFPQVNFMYRKESYNNAAAVFGSNPNAFAINVPAGKNGNKVVVKNLYARTKLTCNNNSSHHLTNIDGNGYDQDYFGSLRAGNHIPSMFEKHFDIAKKFNNTVGFFCDSNTGQLDPSGNADDRDRPRFEILAAPALLAKIAQPAPFWNNIFDYASYNLVDSTEFTAINNSLLTERTRSSIYPLDGTRTLSIKKLPRQGEFDNIHMHGYFGTYADNGQPVIHAPICGYCCFHMHWRWSGLNDEIVKSYLLDGGAGNYVDAFKKLFVASDVFLGWGKQTIYSSAEVPHVIQGAPLIPSEVELHIAVTPTDHTPASKTGNVIAASSVIPLAETEKTIWYSVKITNDFGYEGYHLSMEHGCGYAFRYSKVGEKIKGLKTLFGAFQTFPMAYRGILEDPENEILDNFDDEFLDYVYNNDTGDTSLTTAEFFEMQYRFMKFFNEHGGFAMPDRRSTNQVPAVNWNPEGTDPNNPTNYSSILDTFRNA